MKPLFAEVLAGSSSAALRAQLAAAAQAALDQGKTTLVLDIDNLPSLDDSAISAIVIALRRLRRAGGTIQLVTDRPDHRDRLAVTGLDQVFEVFGSRPEAEDADRRDRRDPRDRLRVAVRAASAAVAFAIALMALPSRSAAQDGAGAAPSDPAALAVLQRLIERNPNLQTYESAVHVDVKMLSFPFLAPKLAGKTYFKRPDSYEVVFASVPWYAKGLEQLYASIGDPSTWNQRFVVTVDGTRVVNGRTEIALRMVQRVRGMIDHEEVYVDEPSATISELQYHYYNGGTISLQQGFSMIDGFAVVTIQYATIDIPHVHAVATARYTDYHTNVAIDNAIFVKNQQAQQ